MAMKCGRHKINEVILVCAQCDNQVVCSQCLVEFHNGHRVTSFDEVDRQIRKRLQDMSADNTHLLSHLDSQMQITKEASSQQDVTAKQIGQQIEKGRTDLHKLVDQAADQLLSECEAERKKNSKALYEQELQISSQRDQSNEFGLKIRNILQNKSNVERILAFKTLENPPTEETLNLFSNHLQFHSVTANISDTQAMYGSITNNPTDAEKSSDFVEYIKPVSCLSRSVQGGSEFSGSIQTPKTYSVIAAFQHSLTNPVSAIKPFQSGLCWVKCRNETVLKLIDTNGAISKTHQFKCRNVRGFDISNNRSINICCSNPNCIMEYNAGRDTASTLFSTGDLQPFYICCTSTGTFYVTLASDNSLDDDPRKKRRVVQYDRHGKVVVIAEKDKFNKKLFVFPFKVSINHSENTIAVLNQESDELIKLMLFDRKLQMKLQYVGEGRIFHKENKTELGKPYPKFAVYNICFDKNDNMLICEKFSKSVQLLSPTCDVLQTLFMDKVYPRAIAIDHDERIWLGYQNGQIKILN